MRVFNTAWRRREIELELKKAIKEAYATIEPLKGGTLYFSKNYLQRKRRSFVLFCRINHVGGDEMEYFSACSINVDVVQGDGSYFIFENDLYIETDNNNIINHFKRHQHRKRHINLLGFTMPRKEIAYNGPFMIESIDTKFTSRQTTIYLTRCLSILE